MLCGLCERNFKNSAMKQMTPNACLRLQPPRDLNFFNITSPHLIKKFSSMNMEVSAKNSCEDFPIFQPDLVNYYCDINVNAICRICLERSQPNKEMFNIFELKQGNEEVCSMIMSCASVQVADGDGLPTTICTKCISKLNVAWQFKLQCENSDAKLRQFYFGNSQQLQVAQDLVGFNFAVKRDYFMPKLGLDSESACDMPTDSTASEEIKIEQSNTEDKKSKGTRKVRRVKINKREQKIHQCDTCGKTFNRREYLTQHIRIHTGEKPYLCHLCDKRFVNSGHLTTHMRTHTGEKPHACSLCPKAFSTKQELHKHTMVHNGERPYACKMCGKRFGSSSNLYCHLKHHTGERNFPCDQCGKAFYTKQELKQHSMTHTGEKPFVCEQCDKRFSQIAHLRRHSKVHK